MKFLLVAVNAKYIHSNPAIYNLRACVGDAYRDHVELAEYTINQYLPEILADLYRRKPDAIGFSCYIWNWKMIQELLEELPKLLPGTALWLGGPEVSYDPAVILERYPKLAGIMVGEGEETFRDLVEYYEEKECLGFKESEFDHEIDNPSGVRKRLPDIPGLCLPSGYTPARPLADLDRIPFVYENLEPFTNRIIYYESSRGCPFRCSYCLSSIDKKVRLKNLETVKRELQFFLDKKVKQVKLVDRTFNCNREYALAVWQYLLKNDNGVTNFHFEISADLLQQEEIELFGRFRPGLAQLEMGVQSCNPQTLQAIRRYADLEKLEKAVAAIGQAGNVHRHLDLIAGLPYEDYESFGKSFNRVYAMRPEQLQLGFLKVLKGSEMCERAEEYGICYQSQPPYEVLYTRWLSYDDVLRLKGIEEMVELYYNSGQFTHTLLFLEHAFSDAFVMYEKLADFYERKGYFTNSPARIYRYQVLLEFVREWDGSREAVYRELLTYDLYLRENLKSRPEFAADLFGYREKIRKFYREEAACHEFLPGYDTYDSKQLEKMTHMEVFSYPVWDREQMADLYEDCGGEGCGQGAGVPDDRSTEESAWRTGRANREMHFVVFDYQRRDPVSGEAAHGCIFEKTGGWIP